MRTWMLFATLAGSCGPSSSTAPSHELPPPTPEIVPPTVEPQPSQASSPPKTKPTPTAPNKLAPIAEEVAAVHTPQSHSTSIGNPTNGRLEGGIALPAQSSGLLFLPTKDLGSRFGTVELVEGLVHAASIVEHATPGAPVTIGDLSRENGGPISGHASHQSGRDVDILFYLRHEIDDSPFLPSKFIPLDPEGRGTDYGDLADPSDDVPVHIDIPRTWGFIAALLADASVAIQKILLVEHLRARLLEYARQSGAPAPIVQRFAEVTCQPRFPHDDHMHIRVFCSVEDVTLGCEDTRPMYPWRQRTLNKAGVKPLKPRSNHAASAAPKPTLKTIQQARAEAGPMHQHVVDFLDRRKAWAKKPHPGRRWCR